jgi:hypothetical protein
LDVSDPPISFFSSRWSKYLRTLIAFQVNSIVMPSALRVRAKRRTVLYWVLPVATVSSIETMVTRTKAMQLPLKL